MKFIKNSTIKQAMNLTERRIFLRNSSCSTRPYFPGVLAIILLVFLLCLTSLQNQRETLATHISPAILRFHVLADSDSKEDQSVKLEVRSLVLDLIKEHLPEHADKQETIQWILSSKPFIEQTANSYLTDHGFSYESQLSLEHTYFPTRTYDNLIFPCGNYDAIRLVLGSGQGHNWWCVLYPAFCFTDEVSKPLSAKELARLKSVIQKDDYPALVDNRPDLEVTFSFLFNPDSQVP